MDYSQWIVFGLEMIGTIAFAFSGALLAIKKKMDIFGVNVLGIVTAIGGGMLRDLILGITPPSMFFHPSYTICAMITASLLFVVIYFHKELIDEKYKKQYTNYMNVMDSIGLGAFTVIGINTAMEASYENHIYLLLFVGVITGVGGGIFRDIMAGVLPYVLVRHVYACASLAGAIVCITLKMWIGNEMAMISGAIVVVMIRLLAAHYRWNLPRIQETKSTKTEIK